NVERTGLMKLFLKEHLLLIVIQVIQFTLFASILALSGFDEYSILLYGILISFFFLCIYFALHYYQRRHVYQKLTSRPDMLDSLLEETDQSPIGTALDQWNKRQYQLFMDQLLEMDDE